MLLKLSATYHCDDCETKVAGLQAVRFAGFGRLQPVIPDRPAFGAAIEQKTERNHAANNRQTPEHALPHLVQAGILDA